MKKGKKTLVYVSVVIVFFLTIPEVVVRILTPEQLARLSDFTSLGGVLNHLLSLMIFLGISSIILAFLTLSVTRKIFRSLLRPKHK
ncbi:hypothetical protein [Erwinia mallotivora]|uniref:hypothetical protein n=1 Tax=Erwinia mallotivora TaxID=69222 RepID=UPI0021BFADD0|nr:hypothetical protein [Erwinia mallotivora]